MISNTFFRYIKKEDLPEEDTPEFFELFQREYRRCTEGVWVITPKGERFFLSGWMYFHFNFFYMNMDFTDEKTGLEVTRLSLPDLRDTDLLINDGLVQAQYSKKGLCIVGSRRLGKTSFASSYILHGALFYKGTKSIIAGTTSKDIGEITSMCSIAYENMWVGFFQPHIRLDWNDKVVLGVKGKDGRNDVFSTIEIRNLSKGNAKEALAGPTPFRVILDEIGKELFGEALEAAKPAFISKNGGWRLVPVLTGTGGDFEKPRDAKEYFFNGAKHNFLEFDIPNEERKSGLFLSGLYRFDLKRPGTLDEFLEQDGKRLFRFSPPYEAEEVEIDLPVQMRKENALDVILNELELARQSGKAETLLKQKMYAPITVDDCFLTKNANPFSEYFEGLARHRRWLVSNVAPKKVELYRSQGEVKWRFSEKELIKTFPHSEHEELDQPIMVWDFPRDKDKFYLRFELGGCDPYNTDQSESSASLGSVYIFRQQDVDLEDAFQDTMVACYTGRPAKMETFLKNTEMLLEWYNARMLHENSNAVVVQHFDNVHKGHLLVDSWQLQKEINPKTTVRSPKGLAPTPKNQAFLIGLVKMYFDEELPTDEGIMEGFTRILDPLLIDEIMGYGEKNTDRFWAFAMGIANLYHHRKWVKTKKEEKDEEYDDYLEIRSYPSSIFQPLTGYSPFLD